MTSDQWKSPSKDNHSELEINSASKNIVIVILKATAQSMKTTETFLKNRGFTLYSTHQMREALSFAIQKNANFILIAADHSNRKVRTLPRILNQALSIPIVGFTENSNNSAISRLTELGLEYNLYPPVSGPAVERMLLKIQKDKESRPDLISYHISAGGSGQGHTLIKGDDLLAAREALRQMLSETSTSATTTAIVPEENSGSYVSSWSSQVPVEKEETSLIVSESTYEAPETEIFSGEKKSTIIPSSGDDESILLLGTQAALDEATRVHSTIQPDEKINPITLSTNMACLTIKSSKYSGYLVAVLGGDRQIDEQFMLLIKERLFSFLSNRGELIHNSESPMNLKLEQVEFETWALEQAEFLKKSIHGKDEIALAFFPVNETSIQLEQSATDNMIKFSLDELKEDVLVDFDLYLYMPENKKYLLYTQEGKIMNRTQKERLKEKGVTHMHIRKEKIGELRRHKAKLFLNDKIDEFKNGKKSN